MKRYAVLRDPRGEHLPLGLLIERDDHVQVVAPDEYGLPIRISEPYEVLQRDLSVVRYEPGDPGYFEQVLVELSRAVTIGVQAEIENTNLDTIRTLFKREVIDPRFAAPRPYAPKTTQWEGAPEHPYRPARPMTSARGDRVRCAA